MFFFNIFWFEIKKSEEMVGKFLSCSGKIGPITSGGSSERNLWQHWIMDQQLGQCHGKGQWGRTALGSTCSRGGIFRLGIFPCMCWHTWWSRDLKMRQPIFCSSRYLGICMKAAALCQGWNFSGLIKTSFFYFKNVTAFFLAKIFLEVVRCVSFAAERRHFLFSPQVALCLAMPLRWGEWFCALRTLWSCRYLALVAALASEADWVFIPEWPPEKGWEEVLCNKLAKVGKNGWWLFALE